MQKLIAENHAQVPSTPCGKRSEVVPFRAGPVAGPDSTPGRRLPEQHIIGQEPSAANETGIQIRRPLPARSFDVSQDVTWPAAVESVSF